MNRYLVNSLTELFIKANDVSTDNHGNIIFYDANNTIVAIFPPGTIVYNVENKD